MFGTVARLAARPATAAAAATVAANVAQGPAHARAPPAQGAARQAAHPPVAKIVDRDTEGWVVAELENDVVLFQPLDAKEVDEAAAQVMHLWVGSSGGAGPSAGSYPSSSPIIEEPADDDAPSSRTSSSGCASDGAAADAIIEAAAAAGAAGAVGGEWRGKRDREQLQDLMNITTRLLRRPGLQREVVQCMLEDAEVRELMLRQCSDLDRYLLAAGISNPPLLPPPTSEAGDAASAAASAAAPAPAPAGGAALVSRLVGVVAGALERAGDALAALGGWLRRHVAAAFGQQRLDEEEEEAEEAEEVQAAEGRRRQPQRSANQVLGGVMVLVVAVFCVAVIRKPLVLRTLSRR